MNKIKEKLIHILGGYTADEEYRSNLAGFAQGAEAVRRGVRSEMQNNYGLPADEQLRRLWECIKEKK